MLSGDVPYALRRFMTVEIDIFIGFDVEWFIFNVKSIVEMFAENSKTNELFLGRFKWFNGFGNGI